MTDRHICLLLAKAFAGFALTFGFVSLAFRINAQDKPGIVAGSGITNGATTTTLQIPPAEEIVHCDKTADSGKPSECRLVGKHTLDEVIQWIWQDRENRREIADEQAKVLRKILKDKRP